MSAPGQALGGELKELGRILREKGLKPFLLPGLAAAACLGGIYWRCLLPAASRLRSLTAQLQVEQGRAEHAQAFEAARAKLSRSYARMPKPENKEGWLFDTVLASARSQGVMLESIAAQTTSSSGEVWLLSLPVSARLEYGKLGRWIARLDSETPFLFVSRLHVARAPDGGEGRCQADMEIEAAVAVSTPAGSAAEPGAAVDPSELGSFDPGPRDPFAAPDELGPRRAEEAVVEEPKVPENAPIEARIFLQGIIFNPGHSSVIVNNEVKAQGQHVLGARIIKITDSAVTFKAEDGRTFEKTVEK